MGRPATKLRNQGSSSGSKVESSKPSDYNVKKKKKKNYVYKDKFKSLIGNSKDGHGYAASQKRKFLSRFNRKLKGKNANSKAPAYIEPKPLADDTLLSHSSGVIKNEELGDDSLTDATLANSLISNNESGVFTEADITSNSDKNLSSGRTGKKASKNLKLVEIDYQSLQEERRKKYEELNANRMEHEVTITKNIEKRKKLNRSLSKRTKRGQPVMASQLNNLLDKIKSSSGR